MMLPPRVGAWPGWAALLAAALLYCVPAVALGARESPVPEKCPYCDASMNKAKTEKEKLAAALQKQKEAESALDPYLKPGPDGETKAKYGPDYKDAVRRVKEAKAAAQTQAGLARQAERDYQTDLGRWSEETRQKDANMQAQYRDTQVETAQVQIEVAKARTDIESAETREAELEEMSENERQVIPDNGLPPRQTIDAATLKAVIPETVGKAAAGDASAKGTLETLDKAAAGTDEGRGARESLVRDHGTDLPGSDIDAGKLKDELTCRDSWLERSSCPVKLQLAGNISNLSRIVSGREGEVQQSLNAREAARLQAELSANAKNEAAETQSIVTDRSRGEADRVNQELDRADQAIIAAEEGEGKSDAADRILGIGDGGERSASPDEDSGGPEGGAGETADPAAAKKYLDEVLEGDPDNPQARSARALANSKLGDNEAACADARAALQGNPDDRRAFGISKLHCPASAVGNSSFETTDLNGRPGAEGSKGLLAMNYSARSPAALGAGAAGGAGKAVDYEKARESRFNQKKARQFLRAGDHQRALDAATKAIELDPGSAGAWFMRASAYSAMGDYAKALADARRGLSLKPGNVELLNTMAYAQNKLGDYEGAAETARAAIKANPTNAAAYANLAYALGKLGDREGMLEALRKASGLNPEYDKSLREAMESPPDADFPFLFPGEKSLSGAKKAPGMSTPKKILLTVSTILVFGVPVFMLLLRSRGDSESEESETSEEAAGEEQTVVGEGPEAGPPDDDTAKLGPPNA